MATLKSTPVTNAEIDTYLDTESDFGFELRIKEMLVGHRIQCEHGGTYDDPITKAKRQFDLRAKFNKWPTLSVFFAIECKNLKPYFPLVVQCVVADYKERFHEVVYSKKREHREAGEPSITIERKAGNKSFYDSGVVGKSCQQIGFKANGDYASGDSEVYGKWSQAVNSAHGLFEASIDDGQDNGMGSQIVIVPMLVVTDGNLWQANYDSSGAKEGSAVQVDRISYFLDTKLTVAEQGAYTISYLEIVTEKGLREFIERGQRAGFPDEFFF